MTADYKCYWVFFQQLAKRKKVFKATVISVSEINTPLSLSLPTTAPSAQCHQCLKTSEENSCFHLLSDALADVFLHMNLEQLNFDASQLSLSFKSAFSFKYLPHEEPLEAWKLLTLLCISLLFTNVTTQL